MGELYSVFQLTFFIDNNWKTENVFYIGDLSKTDTLNDWRFKPVSGKRIQAQFLGCTTISFLIVYPVKISDHISLIKKGCQDNCAPKIKEDMDLISDHENMKAAFYLAMRKSSKRRKYLVT